MSDDVTIVYHTSNTEHPEFEERIQTRLRESARGIPIISVSQIPVDLGLNICVGRRHACDANAFRQRLIGVRCADTKWIAAAEADALYPSEYFAFEPPQGRSAGVLFRWSSVWILRRRGPFARKAFTEGAEVVRRDVLIETLEMALAGLPEWCGPQDRKPGPTSRWPKPFTRETCGWQWWGDVPMVSCKTGNGLRGYAGTSDEIRGSLEPWGSADDLREALGLG